MSKLILLAEDTPDILMVLIELLESEGYRVHSASDGQAAWDYLENCIRCPDLVITDILMPRMNGLELIDKIRTSEKFSKLPVAIYSANGRFAQVAKEKECSFLLKPFDIDGMMCTIKSYMP